VSGTTVAVAKYRGFGVIVIVGVDVGSGEFIKVGDGDAVGGISVTVGAAFA